MRFLLVFLIGALFGTGIVLSGMANPAKVLNFFDLAGSFDPSLAFVMAGALVVAAPGYALLFRARQKPLFDQAFHLPKASAIDIRLIGGSAVFGIGWGIAGFCPGASIPALGLGHTSAAIFVMALLIEILIARKLAKTDFFADVARSR
ncbi:permease [Rhizobium sp. Root274]|uniref:YeeE/YedE family protein n=1 Tax=unclassified Rhizobium TaxID=2613769 RepID=UPI0007139EE0|nr:MULTISPECIES: YeeE/YedE family protein [unclassified Rhizobium]KQW31549.1 permease [Rhizobium sp. Root1240]KRD33089.1 permease [Rhizobium sp. Root274]